MVVVSVHVPKAAGTTLRHILQANFKDKLILDYGDDPLNPITRVNLDPARYFGDRPVFENHQKIINFAVHGHFHIGRYQSFRKAYRLTFLRDPIDILLSIYYYWKSVPKHHQPLHAYFIDQGLDIVGLARLPLVRSLMSKTYFGGIDMKSFDLVGFYDTRERDLRRLAADLDIEPMLDRWENKTSDQQGAERTAMRADRRLIATLTDILKDDIAFYEALRRRG
jgi:hypothetical protein